MSTHSVKSAMQRGIGLPGRFVPAGVLILTILLLLLPSLAFAFAPAAAEADPAQNIAQAGVSVVRLLVTYTLSSHLPGNSPTLQCTGLGALVSSWAGNGSQNNSWVLTDGNLVNPTKLTCASSSLAGGAGGNSASAQLTQIQVLASNGTGGYTATSQAPLALASVSAREAAVVCEVKTSCSQGLALIGFSSDQVQPFIDLSSSSSSSGQQGIELTNATATVPTSLAQVAQFLTPLAVPPDSKIAESGMPIVDAQGNLTGLHLMNGSASLTAIADFVDSTITVPPNTPANTLHVNWDKGIQAYYKHDYAAAQKDFQQAAAANSQFLAATFFLNRAAAQARSSNGGGVSAVSPANTGSPSNKVATGLLGFSLWQVSVVALVLVLLIVVIISLFVGRARRRRDLAKFKEDEKVAERRAAMEAQRIAEMEQRQAQESGNRNGRPLSPVHGEPVSSPSSVANPAHMSHYAAQVSPQMSPVRDMRCPQCGNPVAANTKVCPSCNAWLSPSESGLHLRVVRPRPEPDMSVTIPLPPQYQQPPSPQQPPAPASPAAAPPPMASPAPSYAQVAPNYAAADQPTVLYGFSKNGPEDGEKTVPYNIRKVGSANLGLAVGTRTDPGIKRKHKPNEDSLFAAQEAGMFNSSPQQFGLFVVADGMGGHANGQDASRLAIQTIIDHVLPRLSAGNGLDRNALVQLLTDGVQGANQAVFQSNMQHHADMGTTMSTALVVGATAYVANVGDSRTYLYRDPEGLTKITNDHSVVASLVEAGIINPDDIYTHPKRNQIYRSLGEKPAVEVDSFIVDLKPGDKLLLCTDGLWDMVRDPGIQEVLRSANANPDQTGEALIHAALEGGGEDNVSVIVVYVTESAEQTPVTGIRLLAKPETVQMPPM